jgi:hypothetical protein
MTPLALPSLPQRGSPANAALAFDPPPLHTHTHSQKQINFIIPDKQEVIDIIETVYRGARKGRGLVVAPKDFSTKYRY